MKKHLTGIGIALALALGVLANISPIKLAIAQLNAPQTFAGTAGGTSSAITIAIHNVNQFSDLVAVPLRFFPSGTNVGAATLTINLDGGGTLGPLAIDKQTQTSGALAALTGNEFQSAQIATVMYDGTLFQCLSCYPVMPAGALQDFTGPNIPSGWLLANGSAQSRSAQSVLFSAIAFPSVSATTTHGNATFTVPNASLFQVGWFVGGSNVVCNSQITALNTGTNQVTINNAASAGGATTLSIGPYGQGDCATTFNLPNFVGRISAGVDGTTNITTASCTETFTGGSAGPATPGVGCGQQQVLIARSGLTNTAVTFSGSAGTATSTTQFGNSLNSATSNAVSPGGGSSYAQSLNTATVSSGFTPSGNIVIGGSGNSLNGGVSQTNTPTLPPIGIVFKIIKT